MTKNLFYKSVNKNSYKDMYNFLKNHFTYYTMNSWNELKSIANNVKVYNLKLGVDSWKILELLYTDDYFTINGMIKDWEYVHKGYKVGFNGRSSGYLVLYNDNNTSSVLDDIIDYSTDYEDFKKSLKNYEYYYTGYASLKDYKSRLIEQVELVQDFDKLCDELRDECQYMLDNCKIVENEETYTRTVKSLEWE